ncbi:RING finger protein 150 [Nymphaea thermarum]|nr:RING finger protein 150 [Nymphaea thermarum]
MRMASVVVEDEEARCAVCLEGVGTNREARETSCKHKFHNGCITKWLEEHRTHTLYPCPLCSIQMLVKENTPVAGGGVQGEDEGLRMPVEENTSVAAADVVQGYDEGLGLRRRRGWRGSGWDDDNVEDMEIDDVDYGYSDNREIDDFGMTTDDPNAESLQVESLDSKEKMPLESFSSANSEGATFTEKNAKEATVGMDQPIQTEDSDTGSAQNRSMKADRKVSKGQGGREQNSGKFGSNNEVVQGSTVSWVESTTAKEACLEVGDTMELCISSSPLANGYTLECT